MSDQQRLNDRFQECAKLLNIPVEDIESHVMKARSENKEVVTVSQVETKNPESKRCVELDFGVLKLKLCFEFISGPNWKVQLTGTIYLLNHSVANIEYTFDKDHLEMPALEVNLWVVKASIAIGLNIKTNPNRICPYVRGGVCHWNFEAWRWECANFYEELFCINV